MDPMATARMGRIYASSWWCYTDTKADTYLNQGVDDLTGVSAHRTLGNLFKIV
jgi:hypothetical protein